MLKYCKVKNEFDFKNDDLKDYAKFKKILVDFRRYYNLESFDLKKIDKYLWQAGKEYFPKKYGKKSPEIISE